MQDSQQNHQGTAGLISLQNRSFFGQSRLFLGLILFAIFSLGLAVRFYDLTDPPLDFHPTRQLRSAIIARGMYYRDLPNAPAWQKERAKEQLAGYGLIEPMVFETIVAKTYRLIGSDPVWVARIYASLFWLIGGLALYFMTSAMTNPDGGILAVAYYLFLPFGIIASRSFQPDPLMVMFVLLGLWAFYRWYRNPSWPAAILAGLLIGAAMFIKAVAVFWLLFPIAGLLLFSGGIKSRLRDPQVWVIAALSALPVLVYHVYGVFILGTLESQFEGRFFPQMWRDLGFYVRWFDWTSGFVGFVAIFIALIGALLFSKPALRAFGIGLWLGYFIYGMLFAYFVNTHSYYHLPLIPVIAITLAPVGALIFQPLLNLKPALLTRAVVAGIFLFSILINIYFVRVDMAQEDYRHEPAFWAELGNILGRDSSVIALTQDYGNRLTYYGWITPRIWIPLGQQNYRTLKGKPPIEVQKWFAEKTENKDFFLVTMLNQLDKQAELKQILYDNYPLYAQGNGYLIFDLREPVQ
jgi:hypothetical protein